MIEDAQQLIIGDAWLLVPTGLVLGLTAVAFGLLGDAVRDASQERWSLRTSRTPARRRHVLPLGDRSSAAAGSVLSIRGLSLSLATPGGDTPVVRDVSFDIAAGEVLGLVGESGCGKTLTALAILGLLPSGVFATAGEAYLNGEPLLLGNRRARGPKQANGITMVFQEPVPSLDPVFTVGHQLGEVVRSKRGVTRRQARAEVTELLDLVRLGDPEGTARKYPYQLSGGMAQRVSIARALIGEPDLLIADEPTTALDVSVQAEILDLLRGLSDERGMGVLLVSHDWGVIGDMCERAIVLYAGEVVELAAVRALWQRPRHPYTAKLMQANPYSASPGSLLETIRGVVPPPGQRPEGCTFANRCDLASSDCRRDLIPLAFGEDGSAHRCIHSELVSPVGADRG